LYHTVICYVRATSQLTARYSAMSGLRHRVVW